MKKLLKIAIEAAIQGGIEIMNVYATDFDVEFKGDNSPLTKADKKANKAILSYLIPTEIPIISEENKQLEYTTRKDWQQCWIVDPLDGTKEFVKRNGEFTVNIALIDKGYPILGVIYVPVTRELYFTNATGTSSYKYVFTESEELDTEKVLAVATAIHPTNPKNIPLRVVGSRSHLNEETKQFVVALGEDTAIVSKGSSLKFCLVAEGKADVYPRFAPTMEWDTAAGHAICSAVGLEVTIATTKKPLVYNKEDLLNPHFLVR